MGACLGLLLKLSIKVSHVLMLVATAAAVVKVQMKRAYLNAFLSMRTSLSVYVKTKQNIRKRRRGQNTAVGPIQYTAPVSPFPLSTASFFLSSFFFFFFFFFSSFLYCKAAQKIFPFKSMHEHTQRRDRVLLINNLIRIIFIRDLCSPHSVWLYQRTWRLAPVA